MATLQLHALRPASAVDFHRRRQSRPASNREAAQAGLGGSFNVPDIGLLELPRLLNIKRDRAWGADLFQIFSQLRDFHLRLQHHVHLPVLAAGRGPSHLRGPDLLCAAEKCGGTPGPGNLQRLLQGILAAGRQRPGGVLWDAEVAVQNPFSALRPGNPDSSLS